MKVALAVSPAPGTSLARTRRAGSFADGIMASMSVDEIRVKVGQTCVSEPNVSQMLASKPD